MKIDSGEAVMPKPGHQDLVPLQDGVALATMGKKAHTNAQLLDSGAAKITHQKGLRIF